MTPSNESTESTTLDQVFTCLSHSTRRRILTVLAEDPGEKEEFETRDFKREDEKLKPFKMQVYHRHCPYLQRCGFVDCDHESDTITRGPAFEDVEPLVTLLNAHSDELPQEWP